MEEFNLADEVETLSTLQIVRKTVKLLEKEVEGPNGKEKSLCVSFATNTGKGSGAQVIRVEEFPDFVASLRQAHTEEFKTADVPQAYRPANEVALSTLALSGPENDKGEAIGAPDTVSFRVREGKGSKPARIPLADANEVIEYLEGRVPKMNSLVKKIQAAEKKAAKEAVAAADE